MAEGYGKSFNGLSAAAIARNNRRRAADQRRKRAQDPNHVHDFTDPTPTDDPQMGKRYFFKTCRTCDATEMDHVEDLYNDRRQ